MALASCKGNLTGKFGSEICIFLQKHGDVFD